MIDRFKIGANIRAIRKHLKYKQKVFAKELGVTGSYLSEIEIGRKSPGMDIIVELINKYNANILYLFYGEGNMFSYSEAESAAAAGPVVPTDDWDEKDKLVWFINNIPLIRYAMMEYFINYRYDKEKVIAKELDKYLKEFKREAK